MPLNTISHFYPWLMFVGNFREPHFQGANTSISVTRAHVIKRIFFVTGVPRTYTIKFYGVINSAANRFNLFWTPLSNI
jgi:hypothetical protein